ncbi:hypothetical protein GRZ55_13370 [Chelativorans sp. ZYF759]|uniref:hypothetical protein n=1 Tax=Chelativorans sp. ZYF759 TaxID=2692213 RepID=UPI00145C5B7A|nr:hypothetical protein [Chelativorans sp. ZYF759]NMG40233.1 hypothetical protein [Chelativorans sp. ZYF759]
MPRLIQFVLTNFAAGFCLAAGAASWAMAAGLGPAGMTGQNWLAAALFVQAMGASGGLGYLATAVLLKGER